MSLWSVSAMRCWLKDRLDDVDKASKGVVLRPFVDNMSKYPFSAKLPPTEQCD